MHTHNININDINIKIIFLFFIVNYLCSISSYERLLLFSTTAIIVLLQLFNFIFSLHYFFVFFASFPIVDVTCEVANDHGAEDEVAVDPRVNGCAEILG